MHLSALKLVIALPEPPCATEPVNPPIYDPLVKSESRLVQIRQCKWSYTWGCGVTCGLWWQKSACSHVTPQETLLRSLLRWSPASTGVAADRSILSPSALLNCRCSGVAGRVWCLCWWDWGSQVSLVTCPLGKFYSSFRLLNSWHGLNLNFLRVRVCCPNPPCPKSPILYRSSPFW